MSRTLGRNLVLKGSVAALVFSVSTVLTSMQPMRQFTAEQATWELISVAPEPPRTKPKPVQVLEKYLEEHGVESLMRQPQNRTFAIAHYACPLQAGNRIHHYLNSFSWAIVTNRTLLWDYWDRETCLKYNRVHDGNICLTANRVQDCHKVLERAEWMPSYHEWKNRLNFTSEPQQLHFWTTHLNTSRAKEARARPFRIERDSQFAGVDDVDHHRHGGQHAIVVFPQMVAKSSYLMDKSGRDYLLHTEKARLTAKALCSLGADFLYGMLFRASFRFSDRLRDTAATTETSNTSYTLSLHSRHSNSRDNGCNIQREIRCLKHALARRSENEICFAFVMSDRVCTLQQLSTWLAERDCIMEIANHSVGHSWKSEHGPFAGVGYFQDLVLAVKARSAFVGSGRSSSDLVRELIEYDRRMEAWESFADVSDVPDLVQCIL